MCKFCIGFECNPHVLFPPRKTTTHKNPSHSPKSFLIFPKGLNNYIAYKLQNLENQIPSSALVPMELDDHIERVLWSEKQIAERVSQLASQISEDFKGLGSDVVVVGVATGAFMFLSDLVKKIRLPVSVDFIRAESYGSGTESNGAPTISFDVKIDIKGKHVILVEDIVDTGNTLSRLISHLESKGASSVSVCAFLDKPARRKVHFELVGQGKFYRGYECPDFFIVGYGMDFAELYRNLPYVGVLKPELYK